MRLDELLRFAGLFFEEEDVAYFVFGATAMNFWVPPRNTVDLDIVVAVDKRRGTSVLAQLREKKIHTDEARSWHEDAAAWLQTHPRQPLTGDECLALHAEAAALLGAAVASK